jgi:uncharacterized protein YecT (DUF1311 family)
MITGRRAFHTVSGIILIAAVAACDAGTPSRTKDDIADDSALAADLALANRDTLLVDSIGALPPEVSTKVDSIPPVTGSNNVKPLDTSPSVGSPGTLEGASRPQPTSTPAAAPASPPPASPPAPTTAPSTAAKTTAPKLAGIRACNSPTPENQNECIRASIATSDARLNRIYRALITEMRRQEGVPGGAKDPPSVQRLRIAQRAWLVSRDTECRKRGRGKEGALWARPRARCLAEFSAQRANELADNFSRLTAH